MTAIATTAELPTDVFGAARWLDQLWNSTAKAVSPDLIEWQCQTWGSGRGCGDWAHIGTFVLVAEACGLSTSRNREDRDELIVMVTPDRFPAVAALIERLGEDPEAWPWYDEEDEDKQIAVAAQVLGKTVTDLTDNEDLLEALRIW